MAKNSTGDVATMEVFGRYQVLEPIARGGMAEILLARPVSGVRNICALKRILPAFSHDVQFVSMFIDEARITIGLAHDNIVRLHDFGQVDGIYFMAIEYVDGTDLAALLRAHLVAGLTLPPIVVAAIIRDVCRGLAHAHALADAQGQPLAIVHRDVSPHNVLLSSSGDVKITDFGIAAARHKLSMTTPGTVLGKAAYMAPEQAQGVGVDFRTDLWSVGVMLWECLTGERLFVGHSPVHTLERVLSDVIVPPSSRKASIPMALDALTMTLLSRDPAARPRSTDDVVKALDVVVTQLARSSPLTTTGRFDTAALGRYLAQVPWSEATAPMRPRTPAQAPPPFDAANAATLARPRDVFDDPILKVLVERLRLEHEPWLLHEIGERADRLGLNDVALSAWRTAAAAFASRGLLVQMLVAHHPVRQRISKAAADDELLAIADVTPGNDDELTALLAGLDHHGFGLAILGSPGPVAGPVPLLGTLGPREIVRLADVVGVRRADAGEVIIREGDAGDVLFAVARGRVVVSCRPTGAPSSSSPQSGPVATAAEFGIDATITDESLQFDPRLLLGQRDQRIFLAGLADGDFFGEFSFLLERPRSATVEAVSECLLLEIERKDIAPILAVEPAFTAPLQAFYKERVVELMMARSPIFSALPPEARRALLAKADVATLADGALIVAEGSNNSSFFFIRRGEVEVYRRDDSGIDIFINKLGQGQFFGEIAALRGTPRTVSVRAIGTTTLFRIEGTALQAAVADDPRARQLFDAMIARRTAEARARTEEHHRVFFGA